MEGNPVMNAASLIGTKVNRPDISNPEINCILRLLEQGSLTRQDAMALLVPHLMRCRTVSQLDAMEPVKEFILTWNN